MTLCCREDLSWGMSFVLKCAQISFSDRVGRSCSNQWHLCLVVLDNLPARDGQLIFLCSSTPWTPHPLPASEVWSRLLCSFVFCFFFFLRCSAAAARRLDTFQQHTGAEVSGSLSASYWCVNSLSCMITWWKVIIVQRWVNFLTSGPQWVLKFDRVAGETADG